MARQILTCAALAALTALLIAATACVCVIARTVEKLPVQLEDQIIISRNAALDELRQTRIELLKHMTALELRTDRRIGSMQSDVTSQLARTVDAANAQVTGTLSRVDVALAQAGGLVSEIAPVLVHLDKITAQVDGALPLFLDCDHNADCLANRVFGTSKAIEKAAQNVGVMSAEIRLSLPHTLSGVDRIVANSDKTTAASAKLVTNLAAVTQPLPRWLRWPLAITGAIAPSVGGILAGAAATGAFR